jgi:hypothetical protein
MNTMKLAELIQAFEYANIPVDSETANKIINPEDIYYSDRLFSIACPFGLIGYVIADCLQDALDIAADEGKLDYFAVTDQEDENDETDYLGNTGKPFDLSDCFIESIN